MLVNRLLLLYLVSGNKAKTSDSEQIKEYENKPLQLLTFLQHEPMFKNVSIQRRKFDITFTKWDQSKWTEMISSLQKHAEKIAETTRMYVLCFELLKVIRSIKFYSDPKSLVPVHQTADNSLECITTLDYNSVTDQNNFKGYMDGILRDLPGAEKTLIEAREKENFATITRALNLMTNYRNSIINDRLAFESWINGNINSDVLTTVMAILDKTCKLNDVSEVIFAKKVICTKNENIYSCLYDFYSYEENTNIPLYQITPIGNMSLPFTNLYMVNERLTKFNCPGGHPKGSFCKNFITNKKCAKAYLHNKINEVLTQCNLAKFSPKSTVLINKDFITLYKNPYNKIKLPLLNEHSPLQIFDKTLTINFLGGKLSISISDNPDKIIRKMYLTLADLNDTWWNPDFLYFLLLLIFPFLALIPCIKIKWDRAQQKRMEKFTIQEHKKAINLVSFPLRKNAH